MTDRAKLLNLMISQIAPSAIQQLAPISKALSSLSPFSSTLASVDDSIKAGLEAARDSDFAWLVASTVAVFLGVALEEAEGLMSFLKHWLPLDSITEYRLTKKLIKAGWILIVIGVMGEGIFEVLVSRADGKIHHFDNDLVTEARRQSRDAADSARIAHDEADAVTGIAKEALEDSKDALAKARTAQRELAQAEADSAKAQTAASNALTTATDASARAGKAEQSLGKAESEAKNADSSASNALGLVRDAKQQLSSLNSDLVKLKQQLADRVLDEYHQGQVKLKIAPFIAMPYELAVSDTPEAENLLMQIDAAVSSAGWLYKVSENKAFRFQRTLPNGKVAELITVKGVVIGISSARLKDFRPAAEALARALRDEGITGSVVNRIPDNDPSPNNIHIIVGSKP